MNKLHMLLASVSVLALPQMASAQTQLSGHGFNETGAFQLTVSGTGEVEVSPDLRTWSKYASVTQPTGLEDLASRQLDRRFYRAQGGPAVGYVKVVIAPGKITVLGNSFGSALRFDTPESRVALFGVTNPAVKISIYTNGNFVAHTFESASGNWQPPLRPIRPQEGFAVQNTGARPITLRMSGPVRQGRLETTIPAGSSLLVSPLPNSGPAALLANAQVPDGTQVLWFDEQTQKYEACGFDGMEKPGKWEPKLPDLHPGRAVVVKAPKAITITNTFSGSPAR